MTWYPDADIPIKKPKALEKIERLGPKILNAMDPIEVDEVVNDAAVGVAEEYHKELGGNYEDCVNIVSVALTVTGNSISGQVGSHMIGNANILAQQVCRNIFPEEGIE